MIKKLTCLLFKVFYKSTIRPRIVKIVTDISNKVDDEILKELDKLLDCEDN